MLNWKKSGQGWSTEPAYPLIQTSHNMQEPAAAGVLSHPAERGVDISSSHQAAVTKVTHRQINIQEWHIFSAWTDQTSR